MTNSAQMEYAENDPRHPNHPKHMTYANIDRCVEEWSAAAPGGGVDPKINEIAKWNLYKQAQEGNLPKVDNVFKNIEGSQCKANTVACIVSYAPHTDDPGHPANKVRYAQIADITQGDPNKIQQECIAKDAVMLAKQAELQNPNKTVAVDDPSINNERKQPSFKP
jgi:hypothetical protein